MSESRDVRDPAELAELYTRDTPSHIYALADLCEPYWSRSTWWRRGDAAVGLVGLDADNTVVCSVSTEDPNGTLELVAEVLTDIGPCLVTGPVGIASVFRDMGRELLWDRRYNRFHLPDHDAVGAREDHVIDLGPADAERALELYSCEPDAAFFLPAMLEDNTFVGVEGPDCSLIAIAGTHVVAAEYEAAAIGAVFVHPDARGRGLGASVTRGVVDRLRGRVRTIGLNCTEHNLAARSVYRSLGFVEGLRYEECELAP